MSNPFEENQTTLVGSVIRRRRRNILNLSESTSHQLNALTDINEEYLTESLRKIHNILTGLIKYQDKIISFCGTSEESADYRNIENALFNGLIELDKIQPGNSNELNQKKKEAITIVQGNLKKLDRRLHGNLAELNGEGLPSNEDLFKKNIITEDIKKDLTNSPDVLAIPLSTIAETEERITTESTLKDKPTEINIYQNVVQTSSNKNIDNNADKSIRIERYLQEIGQKFHSYREVSNNILENSKGQELNEHPYQEYHKRGYTDYFSPLKLKTISCNPRDFSSLDKTSQYYKNDKKKETVVEVSSETVIARFIKIIKDYANSFLGIIFPMAEMGNRLALKRIQVVLLQIRLLLIILILEMPFLAVLVFFGLYLYMPNAIQYQV